MTDGLLFRCSTSELTLQFRRLEPMKVHAKTNRETVL